MSSQVTRFLKIRLSLLAALLLGASLTWVAGCQQKLAQADKGAGPPVIPVSHPVRRSVVDFVDFTGSTNSVDPINVRPLITGQLIDPQFRFKEGSEVKKGDMLFEIDPRLFQAAYDQAQAQLESAKAQEKITKITYDRDKSLGGTVAVSEQQIQQDKAAWDSARARVEGAQAAVKQAKVNLDYTRITASIDGRVSRIYNTPGNLVTANSTLLTTIMQMDPMYVYFNVDQRNFERYNKVMKEDLGNSGFLNPPLIGFVAGVPAMFTIKPVNPFQMALEGEEGFPWSGGVDFIDNQISTSTGTVTVRGVFHNVRTKAGTWRFLPGMFVRVRLPMGEAKASLLVIDRAIGSDQGQKFVYVVDDKNKVQYRKVVTGALQEDGMRVIEDWNEENKSGLKETDWVVVGGLPQLRPRTEIKPDQVPMPSLGSNEAPIAGRSRLQPPANPAKGSGVKKQ